MRPEKGLKQRTDDGGAAGWENQGNSASCGEFMHGCSGRTRIPMRFQTRSMIVAAVMLAAMVPAVAAPRAKTPAQIHRQSTAQSQTAGDDLTEPKTAFNQVIGTVQWSNPANGLVVVNLSGDIPAFEGRLITRDFDLNPTAIIQPTAIRRNRMIGAIIVTGNASAGDEVIIPGDAYRAAFGDLLAPTPISND